MAYRHSKHTHHLSMLGPQGLIYEDTASLISHIESLLRRIQLVQDWDCYSQTCNPRTVMSEFERHLIKPALAASSLFRPDIAVGLPELLAYCQFKVKMRLGLPV
ncbi:hypothetical protein, partial [Shewanella sp.]|uniref:hypothetical protein n=1 Tax=Shewanella sp. TaxID=50422 RepID=UPI004048BA3A